MKPAVNVSDCHSCKALPQNGGHCSEPLISDGVDGGDGAHPRVLGWLSLSSIAMGGSMQVLFVLGTLLIGEERIPGQGTAAIPLLVVGILLSLMALPGWIELVLMYPKRVGGIAGTCAEAFRPYNPVLANLTGVCYWWGWTFNAGLCSVMIVTALSQWCLPWLPVNPTATVMVVAFTILSLCGMRWISRFAVPIAIAATALAFISALVPIAAGHVNWTESLSFHLTVPFAGYFGKITSLMAGLYLIGYAAPAFEQVLSHVGETKDPAKNIPRATYISAAISAFYFIVLPIVWLGTIGPESLAKDLAVELGPVYAPLMGSGAKAAAVGFMVFNLLTAIIAPLAGATRTLSQLAEDGLLPRIFSKRTKTDAPLVATLVTSALSIAFIWIGAPIWLVAAANLCYLIGISLPSVAVWLLRRDDPHRERLYRAPRGTIVLGLIAAGGWLAATILGFQQFGLPTVLAGIGFAYSGALLYSWRRFFDRRSAGQRGMARTIHLKLTGAMLLVLVLDGAGYLIAVQSVPPEQTALIAALQDIFVAVALLTITVGLVLPGMISHSVVEVSRAANCLAVGTLADFSRAMEALGKGDLDLAHAKVNAVPVTIHSRDEIGEMAESFNTLQQEVARAALGLDAARQGLSKARNELSEINANLELRVHERTSELKSEIAVRKQVEETLSAEELWTRTIINSTADGIITFDHRNTIKFCNITAQRFFGYNSDELQGKDISIVLPSLALSTNSSADPNSTGLREYEFEARSKDGESHSLALRLTEIQYAGEPVRIAIIQDITERKRAQENVAILNAKLVKAARQAGMADVASSVIHNVGNVLNSVNTSATLITERLRALRISGLTKSVALLKAHEQDLSEFIGSNPQGKQFPAYLEVLEKSLSEDRDASLAELGELNKFVSHIKDIVSRQQSLTGTSGITELVSITDAVEDALLVGAELRNREGIKVVRQFADIPDIFVDKMKLVLILVNIVRNAKHALDHAAIELRQIVVRTESIDDKTIRISISDSGNGIAPENIVRIFSGGFTTKTGGHGFGLHSSALAAQDLGGALSAASEGIGKGATFVLEIPRIAKNQIGAVVIDERLQKV